MQQKGFHRKLTAILSADVAGYSRLMQDDEAATVKTLEAYKQIIFDLIKQHRGRVVDSPGDNLLAEFASVVDAVQCAVAVQKEFHAHNAELPENRRMQFRIGVNLGDVIEEGDRIYGDGVNIAARLESLAEPGGICVSKTAFDQIETKLPMGYEFLGEQPVKNIAKPVGAYRVVLEPRVTKEEGTEFRGQGSRRRMAIIGLAAVLVIIAGVALWQFFLQPPATPAARGKGRPPEDGLAPAGQTFDRRPALREHERGPQAGVLCDGITENIITALSKVPQLFVIARNSTFIYKGKAVQGQAGERGTRGAVRAGGQRAAVGDRIRITVQMVDALNGSQVLSERFDGETVDVFALQDEITIRVLTAVKVKLEGLGGSGWMHRYKGTQGLDCYLKFQEVSGLIQRGTVAGHQTGAPDRRGRHSDVSGVAGSLSLLGIVITRRLSSALPRRRGSRSKRRKSWCGKHLP